ncbi:RHS repeat-associated core domain protein [Hallella bergensis DSM 17361]|uniref:RHS repeat-associated core domain protein n=1 Tax=Hallella bergensis DSM 17361 TaxID=585502 RepID=D1PWK1_9BACT|nr:RHS repeat-associated core domain protein [Hallella bergensis DSM 17361]
MPYNGENNNDYVDGEGFCCNDGIPEAAQVKAMAANVAGAKAVSGNFKENDDYEKLQFYYHPDHLGSSSYITNLDGEVSQHIEYVPFGEVFIDELELTRKSATAGKANCNKTWNTPYRFNDCANEGRGKLACSMPSAANRRVELNAKEFDEETGMYYYGARYYDPRLSLWMSTDPLQEKYQNISTYCYAANNPIKFIDSDGRKLLLASGTTEAFKQKFRAAIMYLHEHNADGIIAQIDKSSTIIYITERVGEPSAFSKTKKTIYWDPNMGVLTSSDKKMSPTTVLNHEADHTLQYLKNPDKYAQDSKTFDPDYDDKEEMRVITGSEQKTALALGEISAGEVTRTDHKGVPYITKSPTTTETKDGKMPKNPFIMDEIVISAPKSKSVNPNNDNNETHNK